MIGQLRILEQREKAKAALGAKFSIKEFHNVVLRCGSMPLNVLAQGRVGGGQDSSRLGSWPNLHDDFPMNPHREELPFQLALTRPAVERSAWLDRECGGDAVLRQRLDALQAAHEQPETQLASQADSAPPTIKLNLTGAPGVSGAMMTLARCNGDNADHLAQLFDCLPHVHR
jgi:hypothetical protein